LSQTAAEDQEVKNFNSLIKKKKNYMNVEKIKI